MKIHMKYMLAFLHIVMIFPTTKKSNVKQTKEKWKVEKRESAEK